MTDLHLVSWNRPKMTELVIKTIHRNTPREDYRLIVLDNASEESTVEMLQNLHENGYIDEFLPIKTNLGLEAARDFLLREATESKRFVCVDNDCLPPKNWLEDMNRLMDENPDYAAISQRTDPMIGTGNIFEDETEDLTDFPHPGGSYRLMNTAITRRLGGWDRHAPGRGSEERYICGKLNEAGYKTAFCTHIKSLHLFGHPEKTDRWGYDKNLKPEDTGHSDVWHPKFAQGDVYDEVLSYCGKELTDWYFHDNSHN